MPYTDGIVNVYFSQLMTNEATIHTCPFKTVMNELRRDSRFCLPELENKGRHCNGVGMGSSLWTTRYKLSAPSCRVDEGNGEWPVSS